MGAGSKTNIDCLEVPMKVAIVLFLLVSPAFAQNMPTDPPVAPGCGTDDAKFEVTKVKGQHPVTQPDTGKALMYFIEDDREYAPIRKPTMLAGLDGRWVGATNGNSYFSFSVAPGEHHICASWQSKSQTRAVAHFTAEPGKVYYFAVKNRAGTYQNSGIDFGPLDSDQGLLLVSTFTLSTFQLKK
jgi:hypothetical protein